MIIDYLKTGDLWEEDTYIDSSLDKFINTINEILWFYYFFKANNDKEIKNEVEEYLYK